MQVEKFKNNLDDYSRKYLLDFIFLRERISWNGLIEDEINDFIGNFWATLDKIASWSGTKSSSSY